VSEYLDEMIGYEVQQTAEWRSQKAEQFPEDARNVVAAEMLGRLAEQITASKDSKLEKQISNLQDAINEADSSFEFAWTEVADSVSEELRSIGFHTSYDTAEELLEWYRTLLVATLKRFTTDKRTQDNRVRRKGRSLGYQVRKSREWKHVPNLNNMGEYMLVDNRGFCMLGSRYDASLDEIESYLDEQAAAEAAA
jgi:hypothetical protein